MKILNFSDFLSEGLIKSQPIQIVLRKLRAFRIHMRHYAEVNDDNQIVLIIRIFDWNNSGYNSLVRLLNLLGWFIAGVRIGYGYADDLVDLNDVNNAVAKYKEDIENDDESEIHIVIEKKFEVPEKIVLVGKDRFLYHITEARYVKKVLKNGLVPKDKIKLSWHPHRIYLATFDGLKRIRSKYCTFVDEPVILKINPDGLTLYDDPNLSGAAFYVTDNIAPSKITVTDISLGCHGSHSDLVG